MAYVISCGDEGVQINEGTRLAFAGSGLYLDGFSQAVKILKQLLGDDLRIASSEENDWIKSHLDLKSWDQVNASTQQQVQALADKENLLYSGYFPFADPKNLAHEIRGHMVRPQGIHIATKICFTLGGGEQKYNLGCFVISADWVAQADTKLIKQIIQPQIDFYTKLNHDEKPLFVFEEEGALGKEVAEKNKAALTKAGLI